MSSKVPTIVTLPEDAEKSEEPPVDPKEADKVAEKEYKSKYSLSAKRPSSMAQRKISAAGGKQYFDSGEYNSASSQKREEMIVLPHATDAKINHPQPGRVPPHLAHLRMRPKAAPSNLASPVKSPLAD